MSTRGTIVLHVGSLGKIYFPVGSDAGDLTVKRLRKVQKWVRSRPFDWDAKRLPQIREEVIKDMVRNHVLIQEEADAGTEKHPYEGGMADVFNEYEYNATLLAPTRRDQEWRLDVHEIKEAYYREQYSREHSGAPVPAEYFG